MTHNLKGGVGPFNIFHIGGMTYTVERDGKVLDTVENISNAYRSAGRLQDQAKVAAGGPYSGPTMYRPTLAEINACNAEVGRDNAASDHDDDMFDGDEREEVDHQAARLDHARDLRKHGG